MHSPRTSFNVIDARFDDVADARCTFGAPVLDEMGKRWLVRLDDSRERSKRRNKRVLTGVVMRTVGVESIRTLVRSGIIKTDKEVVENCPRVLFLAVSTDYVFFFSFRNSFYASSGKLILLISRGSRLVQF